MTISQEVERQQEQRQARNVASALASQGIITEIQRAVPKHMSGDRIARVALTLVRKSDLAKQASGGRSSSLSECSPESFVAALLTASAMGLEVGVNDEAYLVPYRQECTLIVGYHGMLKLAWQHPLIENIGSGFAWPEDEFDYDTGMDPYVKHKPAKGVQRGKDDYPELFYAWAKMRTGGKSVVVLSREEVKALRGGKEGADPRFKGGDPQFWMGRKTAVRQLLKPLPKSVAAHWAHQVDEQPGSQLFVQKVPQQIAEQVEQPADAPALGGPVVGAAGHTGGPNDDSWHEGPNFTQPAVTQGEEPEGWK